MTLSPGARLGPYEVTATLGAGGMGEVYRATDTNLGRQVAIKVLPDAVAQDPDRLARFDREARTLATLNHPNIAAVYGLERAGGHTALVMELVEGPTLADRLTEGPIRLDDALPIARQLAEALEAAHEQGVVHRDFKPANIKLRPDGTVKVLDFGLAKAVGPEAGVEAAGQTQSPTITTPAVTQAGVVLGTAAYMSPEQARGRAVDKRADVWAFGCVLYEMLTARRLFAGDEVADTLALVLTKEPDWSALPASTPASLRRLIQRCLARDPRRRLRDIGDARTELEDLAEGRSQPREEAGLPDPARGWGRGVAASVALVCLVGGVALGVFATSFRARPAGDGVRRYEITSTGFELRNAPGYHAMDLAVTPDGRRIVYTGGAEGTFGLFVRDVDRLEPRMLAGLVSPQNPFLSADGRWVGFLEGSELKKINIDGGPVVTIANVGATALLGASWGADDLITFNTNASADLLRIPADGGAIEVLATPDLSTGEAAFRYPDVLPDGRTVLFTVADTSGSIENAQLVALNLGSGARTVLVRGAGRARYVDTGHLVFGIGGELRAVGFDAVALELTGTPVPVVDGVETTELGGANFDVAADGTLVYVAGTGVDDRNELVWVDRDGDEAVVRAGVRAFSQARVSPDGTRVALDIREQQNDIWIWEFASETLTRLTLAPLADRQPIWSPDGRYIVFASDRSGSFNLFRMLADGTGEPEQLTDGPGFPYPTSFTPDGAQLVYWQTSPRTGLDLGLLSPDGDRSPTALLATSFDERNAELSPDGRWLAYQSNESGRNEVYVQPFPDLEGRWQVSTDGGTRPMWRPDGRELFYWRDSRLMVAPVEDVPPGAAFPRISPRVLLERDYPQTLNSRTFDVAPDGERFLMIRGAGGDGSARRVIVLVQHWFDELRTRVPAGG